MTYKLNNLEVTDVKVDGIDLKDHPDYVDAYIDSAKFVSSGKELNDEELIQLQEENPNDFYDDIMDEIYDMVDLQVRG